jgi:hypothetical protein
MRVLHPSASCSNGPPAQTSSRERFSMIGFSVAVSSHGHVSCDLLSCDIIDNSYGNPFASTNFRREG